MKKRRKWILWSLVFLGITNVNFISKFIDFSIDEKAYRYTNINGTFKITPVFFKSPQDATSIKWGMERFINKYNPPQEERVIYRLFWRNPLKFWRWYYYLTDEIYDFPYIKEKDLKLDPDPDKYRKANEKKLQQVRNLIFALWQDTKNDSIPPSTLVDRYFYRPQLPREEQQKRILLFENELRQLRARIQKTEMQWTSIVQYGDLVSLPKHNILTDRPQDIYFIAYQNEYILPVLFKGNKIESIILLENENYRVFL